MLSDPRRHEPLPPTAPVHQTAPTGAAGLLNLAGLRATPLAATPFPHLVMRDFVSPDVASAVRLDFPESAHGGLAPAPTSGADASGDGAFARLLQALRAPETTQAFSDIFGLPLSHKALMIHVRSWCRAKDGRIHTDSESKLVTALLYFNADWTAEGGRLRLLRRIDDMDDMLAEVPPLDGTLVAFRRTDNSFHGHKSFEGPRRYVMLNWMVDEATARREESRHGFTAYFKRLTTGMM